jgi:hypothetical protein
LQFIKARIGSGFLMYILYIGAIISQPTDTLRQKGIACGDGSTITKSAQILCGIEGKPGGITK